MKQYRCIIIEDEPLAMERTKLFVEKVPFLSLQATFDNALEGLAHLQKKAVEILFLDINMDELSGVELLESTNLDCQVILTTAFPEYALRGYELNVTDYLLKPFPFPRFLQAADKARARLAETNAPVDYLFLKTENRLEKISLNDVLYIEGMRDYRRVHTSAKRIMTLETFTDLERRVPPTKVCRIHKSYMVGLANIEAVERSRVLVAGKRLPISDTYRRAFFSLINQE